MQQLQLMLLLMLLLLLPRLLRAGTTAAQTDAATATRIATTAAAAATPTATTATTEAHVTSAAPAERLICDGLLRHLVHLRDALCDGLPPDQEERQDSPEAVEVRDVLPGAIRRPGGLRVRIATCDVLWVGLRIRFGQ